MIVEDQREVIAFLLSPATYGPAVATVDLIETHSAIVFLAGDRAFKLKRAVRYDYLDFSTLERRRAACEAELMLNRRTAPDLYLGVVAVTRSGNGSLTLGGTGAPVDWLVQMVRFDQAALLDRLATCGNLDLAVIPDLAGAIGRFHASAQSRYDHGGRDGMAWVIDGNAAGFAEQGRDLFEPAVCEQVTTLARAALARHTALLDARRAEGWVRMCHGDLHLRNIVLLPDGPTLFDGVEFNDRISCVDVLYDLAFLVMDLWRLNLTAHASVLFNEYLTGIDTLPGVALMPLFLSCRAAVRAKTSVTAARLQTASTRAAELSAAGREYLALAASFLQTSSPRLVAIGGLAGSGKSTLARRLAPAIGPAPGAVVLRSDVLRKSLFGLPATARLGPEGYMESVTQDAYRRLAACAAVGLRAGYAVIVDAVFQHPWQRTVIAEVARACGVPFTGLWLDAPMETLAARIEARRGDASDATVEVLRHQAAGGTGAITWVRIDASDGIDSVQRRAETALSDTARSDSIAG